MENQPQQPKRTGATNGTGSFPAGASDHSSYTHDMPWEPTDAADSASAGHRPDERTAVHEEGIEDASWTSRVPSIPPTGSGAPHSPYLRPRAETAYYLQPQRGPSSTTALVAQRTKTQQECPKCGAMQPTSTSVCMECGAFFPAVKSRLIRCRRCGTQASANLSLCPGCGRVLEAASPRFTNWIVPSLLVVLFLLLVQQWQQGTSLSWVGRQISASQAWVSELSERLDPQITISTLPAPAAANRSTPSVADIREGSEATDSTAVGNSLFALAPVLEPTSTDADESTNAANEMANTVEAVADATEQDDITSVLTATAVTPAAAVAAVQVEPTATAVAPTATTVQPTATASPIPSLTPSPTASPTTATATATAAPSSTVTRARLLADDSTSAVGAASAGTQSNSGTSILRPTATSVVTTPTTIATTIAATATETATVLPTNTATATPPPTPTPTSAATATASAATVYIIKGGDTPSSIAAIYDISVNELLAANGLGLDDARRLRVGQELVIPSAGESLPASTVPPTPTTRAASATATSVLPTATSVTPATTIRLDAPQLRSPENGAFLSCGGDNALVWLPVSFIREDDSYLLHLGFINGYNTDGSELIVWVLEQQLPANVTIWKMDEALCSLAPQEFGRQWRWYVEVIETTENGTQSVSQPSAIWAFSWN